MSHVYVTSDWHIGHTGISTKFRTQFSSDEEHDDYILGTARAVVTKRDVLIVLGDVALTKAALLKIKDMEFPCRMLLVRGNHDGLSTMDYLHVFDEVYGAWKYKKYWLTHIPIHPQELYNGMNIHGHCHRGGPYEVGGDTRYFNAILEFNDYMPVNMQVVGQLIHDRYEAKQLSKEPLT